MRFARFLLFLGMIGGFASGFAHVFSGGGPHCHRAAEAPATP